MMNKILVKTIAPVTFLVQEMTARRYVSCISAGVDVLHTHGTVVVGRVLDTFVRLVTWQTQAARVAVLKLVTSTHPETC